MIVAPLNHKTWHHGQTLFDGEAVRYGAVIFDLFGTLVDDPAGPRYSDVLRRIASAVITTFRTPGWAGTSCCLSADAIYFEGHDQILTCISLKYQVTTARTWGCLIVLYYNNLDDKESVSIIPV